ncbi:ethanolamine utilization protein EutR, partial [Klebsiella pneumoniae]
MKLTPKVEVDNVHQRQTTDVYEHALTITAWQQIYDQLHPGKFHGEFTEILLDDIQVFREYTGLALRQSCLVCPNSFWFGIPATRGEQVFIVSQCLGSAEVATRPGSTEFELITPADYRILGLVPSDDVCTRPANFWHHQDPLLQMFLIWCSLAVQETHK